MGIYKLLYCYSCHGRRIYKVIMKGGREYALTFFSNIILTTNILYKKNFSLIIFIAKQILTLSHLF